MPIDPTTLPSRSLRAASAHVARRRALGALGATALGLGLLLTGPTGCLFFNSHVFDQIPACEVAQESVSVPIQPTKAADILIVVDNSGSMCEEQANLVANFYNPNPAECPIADVASITDERFINPTPEIVRNELSQCGFIQILAAYENDFRVGVITTDVGQCDNRFGFADDPAFAGNPSLCSGEQFPGWGRRPQRGCLQAPAGWEQKFLSRDTENIGERFSDILANIQTFGSGFERGLDAMRVFLEADQPHQDCASDRGDFLRDDAQLLVIFLTDEEDCSHINDPEFPDENLGEGCVGVESYPEARMPQVSGSFCYDKPEYLTPVADYADFLKTVKPSESDVRVAVIAGGVFNADGQTVPGGCRVVGDVPDGQCTPSKGSSNFNGPGQPCDPVVLAADGLPPCCEADAGNRYYELANLVGTQRALTDSICFASFRETMIQVAQFAARVEFVTLDTPPPVPAALQVEILRADTAAAEPIERIPDGEDVGDRSGWQLEGCCRVQFHGEAVPQPGDDIRIFVLRDGSEGTGDGEQCVGDFNSGS